MRKAQAFLPALFMKLFSYFGAEPVRMTGNCLTFLPTVRRSSAKNHIGRPFKITDVLFPAHPTPAMLQARKLLLHFPATIRAGFIAGSHPHPP